LPNTTRTLPASCSLFVQAFFLLSRPKKCNSVSTITKVLLSFFQEMWNDRSIKYKVTKTENSLSINACYRGWNNSHVATWLQFPSVVSAEKKKSILAYLNTPSLCPCMKTREFLKYLGKVGWKYRNMENLSLNWLIVFNSILIKRNAERSIA